jgi:phosphatidylserine decarboxylase
VVLLVPGAPAAFFFYMGWIWAGAIALVLAAVLVAFMVYFFRDPDRPALADVAVVVSGADGWVRCVEEVPEPRFLKTNCLRISTFLTPFDVHVNRAPIGGQVKHLGYTPGKHLLTIQEASAEYNEHSTIVIEGPRTRCLVRQIVGPLVRRVIYWLELNQSLRTGDRIGMMKFGSRLDVYLPADDVEVLVKKGDRVFAGITAIARIKKGARL